MLGSKVEAPADLAQQQPLARWMSFGCDTACRLHMGDDTTDGLGQIQVELADTLQACEALCSASTECGGVEFWGSERRCELFPVVGFAKAAAGFECLVHGRTGSFTSSGAGTACRLSDQDTTSDGQGSVAYQNGLSLEQCKVVCQADLHCHGIEYNAGLGDGHCELWSQPIGFAQQGVSGFECLTFAPEAQVRRGTFQSHGSGSVCRLHEGDATFNGDGSVLYGDATTLDACKASCAAELSCLGVEYKEGASCELWTQFIGHTKSAAGYECLTFHEDVTGSLCGGDAFTSEGLESLAPSYEACPPNTSSTVCMLLAEAAAEVQGDQEAAALIDAILEQDHELGAEAVAHLGSAQVPQLFYLVNEETGRCVTEGPDARAVLGSCVATSKPLWMATSDHRVQLVGSGKVLTVDGFSSTGGQTWATGSGLIVHTLSLGEGATAKCMGVRSDDSVVLGPCSELPNRLWTFHISEPEPIFLRSKATGKCIRADGSSAGLRDCIYTGGVTDDHWQAMPGGFVKAARWGEVCLGESLGLPFVGPCEYGKGVSPQRWERKADGRLFNKQTGMCIGEDSSGSTLQMVPCNSTCEWEDHEPQRPQELHYVNLTTTDPGAICNDGTAAAYYFRGATTTAGMSTWLVYLQGGFWCTTEESCRRRQQDQFDLTSSTNWPKSAVLKMGIFSDQSPIADANLIYVPYCSSDGRMGDGEAFGMQFRGWRTVRAVLSNIANVHGIQPGHTLVLGGMSAGSRGAMVHLEKAHELMPGGVHVFGFLDSPLWLDNIPEVAWQVDETKRLLSLYSHPDALGSCASAFPEAEHWKCLFGEYRVPLLPTPYMLLASQADSFGIGSRTDADFLAMFAHRTRAICESLTRPDIAVFSHTCRNHARSGDVHFVEERIGVWKGTSPADVLRQSLERLRRGEALAKVIEYCEGPGCGPGCI